MAEPGRTVPSRLTAGAVVLLGLVFLWRLPLVAGVANYLSLVALGIATAALVGGGRLLAGHADGRPVAVATALMALAGQVLNTWVGLPAAEALQGSLGWASVVVLGCGLTVLGTALLSARAPVRARGGRGFTSAP